MPRSSRWRPQTTKHSGLASSQADGTYEVSEESQKPRFRRRGRPIRPISCGGCVCTAASGHDGISLDMLTRMVRRRFCAPAPVHYFACRIVRRSPPPRSRTLSADEHPCRSAAELARRLALLGAVCTTTAAADLRREQPSSPVLSARTTPLHTLPPPVEQSPRPPPPPLDLPQTVLSALSQSPAHVQSDAATPPQQPRRARRAEYLRDPTRHPSVRIPVGASARLQTPPVAGSPLTAGLCCSRRAATMAASATTAAAGVSDTETHGSADTVLLLAGPTERFLAVLDSIFDRFDADGDGQLSMPELHAFKYGLWWVWSAGR